MYRRIGVIVWQGIAKKTDKVKDRRVISCKDGSYDYLTQDHFLWRALAIEVVNVRVMPPEHWVYKGSPKRNRTYLI